MGTIIFVIFHELNDTFCEDQHFMGTKMEAPAEIELGTF